MIKMKMVLFFSKKKKNKWNDRFMKMQIPIFYTDLL